MKVTLTGLRGFPHVQGGVETHAEHLCPLLHDAGCDIEVIVRRPYMPLEKGDTWNGVRFLRLPAPKSRGLEAIVHTFLSVLYAGIVSRPDVLHIQAIGPAIMTPLARMLGLRVVVTHHGPDYDRQKWGRFARWVLRTGEDWGMRFAHRRIAISTTIRKLIQDKYGRDSELIPNGVMLPELPETSATLERFGLTRGRYVLLVSRLVPEKRHLDLIAAFAAAGLAGWKLALVGASDHPDEYTQRVHDAVRDSPDVVATGFQNGLALRELYGHAGVFVLPSSHEGLPIALLEALSYGLPVIASDIPANLEVGLDVRHYFPLGDAGRLAQKLNESTNWPRDARTREDIRRWVVQKYDWHHIAEQTLAVYHQACGRPPVKPARDHLSAGRQR
jgi:glycosyltransferase involved in cell wall biosynthesis